MTASYRNIFRVTGLCAENSPITGEFPAQRPVTRSFDAFFDLRLNKQLSKQSWGWWFETPLLWRRCDDGLSPVLCQACPWTNAGFMLSGSFQLTLNQNTTLFNSFEKRHLLFVGLNALTLRRCRVPSSLSKSYVYVDPMCGVSILVLKSTVLVHVSKFFNISRWPGSIK